MILSKTLRTPICIDPQFKAIACIKATHQHQNNVKLLRFDTTNDAVGELLKAITLGEIVVLEDVHAHIDPILMDLLEIKLLSWFSIHFSHQTSPTFACHLFTFIFYSSILPKCLLYTHKVFVIRMYFVVFFSSFPFVLHVACHFIIVSHQKLAADSLQKLAQSKSNIMMDFACIWSVIGQIRNSLHTCTRAQLSLILIQHCRH